MQACLNVFNTLISLIINHKKNNFSFETTKILDAIAKYKLQLEKNKKYLHLPSMGYGGKTSTPSTSFSFRCIGLKCSLITAFSA